jgi:Cu+-exporting ATPase
LENISRIQLLLLDKTGTLTLGEPTMSDFISVPNVSENDFLEFLAAAESLSNHPLARAAVRDITVKGITWGTVGDYQEMQGFGISCSYRGATLLAGSIRHLKGAAIDVTPFDSWIESMAGSGKSIICLAVNGSLYGMAAFTDRMKDTSPLAVSQLKSLGLKVRMLTGDRHAAAVDIARRSGVDGFDADVTPARKLEIVREFQQQGLRVGMVGDGINDAPALALADIGIAIGSGADVAKETGDVILVRSDLMDVVRAVRLGKATLSKIKQNLFWAFFYNMLGIPVAAGLFYYPFGMTLSPEFAGLAMAFSSVSVVMNSMLLKRVGRRL